MISGRDLVAGEDIRRGDRVQIDPVSGTVVRVADSPRRPTSTRSCSCDGPPHTWSPGWCPKDGPR